MVLEEQSQRSEHDFGEDGDVAPVNVVDQNGLPYSKQKSLNTPDYYKNNPKNLK